MLGAKETLAVLGGGTMGEAIVRGLLASGRLRPAQILVTDVRADLVRDLAARHKVRTGGDNVAAARAAAVAIVCVKPQHVGGALDSDAMRAALKKKLVMSIAAGVRLEQIARWLPGSALIRAMPNTPAVIGEGMTAIARGPGATDAHAALALEIFGAVGRAVEIEEKSMDVATALGASGPAFAFVILEALADGAVRMGLGRDLAVSIAAQMLQGAARMVRDGGVHPGALKDRVATPGGCTIAGLLTLEDGRIRSVLARAVEEATRAAAGLGQGGR